MKSQCRLLMIGAMYENGGNTTHRFLDGHPELFVYPFESQVGTHGVRDEFTSMFPVKYRWPSFDLDATPAQDYRAIIDEEGKVRARTPHVSKFRHLPFDLNDDDRCSIYQEIVEKTGRTRGHNVAAFFEATFRAWKDHKSTGRENGYVGYSPIIGIDAHKILDDMPNAHVLHVVRNPWSAYADTKKRPVPLSLAHYMTGWVINQERALMFRDMFPDRMHIVRIEDVLENSRAALAPVLERFGVATDTHSLQAPSWNGNALEEVYPWGTIRTATPSANAATARELSSTEQAEIRVRTARYLDMFGYGNFLD
jgi:hypothetical protein